MVVQSQRAGYVWLLRGGVGGGVGTPYGTRFSLSVLIPRLLSE
jgi:hypothetical protein